MTQEESEQIGAFLRGDLTKAELEKFNARLESDGDFKRQFEIEQKLFLALGDTNWATTSSSDPGFEQMYKAASSDEIKQLDQLLTQRRTGSKEAKVIPLYKKPWFKWVAAIIVVGLVVSSLLLGGKQSPEELYASYLNLEEVPTLTVRGSDTIALNNKLEALFASADYDGFLSVFENTGDGLEPNPTLLTYAGLAYLKTDRDKMALKSFDQLIASTFLDAQRGYWYKALVYLKMGQSEQAKTILQKIDSESLYKAESAREILEKLQ